MNLLSSLIATNHEVRVEETQLDSAKHILNLLGFIKNKLIKKMFPYFFRNFLLYLFSVVYHITSYIFYCYIYHKVYNTRLAHG